MQNRNKLQLIRTKVYTCTHTYKINYTFTLSLNPSLKYVMRMSHQLLIQQGAVLRESPAQSSVAPTTQTKRKRNKSSLICFLFSFTVYGFVYTHEGGMARTILW